MPAPHDELFRKAFGNPERARQLLRVALPQGLWRKLDLQALRITPGTFLDRKLRLSQSDLLLETTTLGRQTLLVYILFEHKSSPDPRAPFQLLRYMVGIWETWSSRKENRNWRQLPPIIPVIFSQAPRSWRYPLDFAVLVRLPAGMDLRALVPSFQPLLIDLARKEEAELGEDRIVNALLRIFKHIKESSPVNVRRALAEIVRLHPSEREPELVQAVLTYLFRARQGRSARSILEAVPKGGLQGEAMTVAEALERKGRRKGRLEGKLEGKLEGELQSKQEVLARLVERKFGLTERDRKTIQSHTSTIEIDAAIDAVLSARSKGAVLKHLR